MTPTIIGYFVIAILVSWLLVSLFLGRLNTLIVEKGFSTKRVGVILVVVSFGLFGGYTSISEGVGRNILLSLMILAFLFGIGLIRVGTYKYLYGKDWEDKKK
ncbi:MAG: hypothetical protein CL608_29585 [Anaerolineaceae bacterium]|nr:hypothetical protein [Anaerolineaceae bacterium]